ncbi:sulfotransferase 6B1-like [Emys orbicularis]|uniref:sulfotransferase 6B1-like n=1 Tax=Emys orbicularis TaxID=82168 RepID=UPI0031FCAD28
MAPTPRNYEREAQYRPHSTVRSRGQDKRISSRPQSVLAHDGFHSEELRARVSWGSYFDHIIEWNKHFDDENIMFITYEELKENPNLGVKKIAEFFGFSVTDEESQAVADRNSFQTMKENSHKTHGALGNVLFRKGSVSDWKNLFTEAQNQEMDKKFEESLAGTKLGAKIKYGVYCKA